MLGCAGAIIWGVVSLTLMGGLASGYENPAYRSGDPSAPAPTLMPTPEEWALFGLWGLVWLAGIVLWFVASWLWRIARSEQGVRHALKLAGVLAFWGVWLGGTIIWLWWRITPDPNAIYDDESRPWPLGETWIRAIGLIYIVAPLWAIFWAAGIGAWRVAHAWFWRQLSPPEHGINSAKF